MTVLVWLWKLSWLAFCLHQSQKEMDRVEGVQGSTNQEYLISCWTSASAHTSTLTCFAFIGCDSRDKSPARPNSRAELEPCRPAIHKSISIRQPITAPTNHRGAELWLQFLMVKTTPQCCFHGYMGGGVSTERSSMARNTQTQRSLPKRDGINWI